MVPHLLSDPEPLVCDVPWLHADAPTFQADDGTVMLPACPFCGGRHRHGGFGHRLAHYDRQLGRGYVLGDVGQASPAAVFSRPVEGSGSSWAQGP